LKEREQALADVRSSSYVPELDLNNLSNMKRQVYNVYEHIGRMDSVNREIIETLSARRRPNTVG